ncbi:MAG: hypothetical protein IJD10_04610 [Clostridia bacterium]|nr:hypothetical protein [Clostridia bacterium]
MELTKRIRIGGFRDGHVQGIAVDNDRKYMYFSFTTRLVKTDMQGNIIGSVKGLAGHLGCIAYNYEDGRVYGSLEFKHDSIGKGILANIGREDDIRDGFYTAIFDVDRIDRDDMDAERDGVMTAVYLDEVYKDYSAEGHRFGCSGIDGMTFAPKFGSSDGKNYLYVAYGIYSDPKRDDNDDQVLLKYDISDWSRYEKPLLQTNMHRSGPEKPDGKYFVYTGNTTYGVQNLEYDPASRLMLAAVYRGQKPCFPNYPMFFIDCNEKSFRDGEKERLSLANIGLYDERSGIRGAFFNYGQTGMISLGDGRFYFSKDFYNESGWGSEVVLYRFDGQRGEFEEL